MPVNVSLQESDGWIEMQVTGDLTGELLRVATDDVLRLLGRNGIFGVLVDLREVGHAPSASTVQGLPGYYEMRHADKRMHVAIVLPERGDAAGLSRFYKQAAARRGYRVRQFDDRGDAERWLAEFSGA